VGSGGHFTQHMSAETLCSQDALRPWELGAWPGQNAALIAACDAVMQFVPLLNFPRTAMTMRRRTIGSAPVVKIPARAHHRSA
jgi:hypothetical protein